MRARIIVIGAGPGGLATAMLLANSGAEVTLLERQERVGGRSASLDLDGFRFDTGPTFFLYPSVLQSIFEACGFDLNKEVNLKRLDPLYDLVFENAERLRVHADVKQLMREIGRFNPEDAVRLPALLAKNRVKLNAFKPVLERPFIGYSDFLQPAVLAALRYLKPWRSVDQDLAEHFQDPRIRLAFSFQSKYLGMSPYRCPSLFTILSFLEHEYGVFHPIGGCGAMMTRMGEVAARMGVNVRLNADVEEILFEGRRAVGVRVGGETIPCDGLVVNADFARAMQRLVPAKLRRRWGDANLETKKYSCSTFMLYLGIKGSVDLAHHTILLAEDYRTNLQQIETGVLPPTPSLYVQNACVTDPGLAPPGTSTLYVLVPVPHMGPTIDWQQETVRYRRLVIERLKKLGIEDLERRIVVEKVVTPVDWQDMQIFRGATFNLAHNLSQMLYWRPRNRFEELDGVYLVGGGTHPGSGLPVIFEGARITARLLSEDLGLPMATGFTQSPFETAPAMTEVA